MPGARVIGLIADTHGLVRPECFAALAGVELILHAGDVGGRDVLAALSRIAPTQAVYGNTDPPGDPSLTAQLAETIDGVTVHVSHGHEIGSPTPQKLLARYDADVLVFGHTHKPQIVTVGSRLVVNPGSAGPRRFHYQPTVARLTLDAGRAFAEIVTLTTAR